MNDETDYGFAGIVWRRWLPTLCLTLRCRHRWARPKVRVLRGQRVVVRMCKNGCGIYRARSQSIWTAPKGGRR